MDLQVIDKGDGFLEISLTNVDISLLMLLQELLLKDKRVLSASVKRVHPLTREDLLFVKTTIADPRVVLKETLDHAYDLTKDLKEDLMRGLK